MAKKPLRIVQITDTHLFLNKKKTLLGVSTHDSFLAVIDLIKADPVQPDLILLTGDLSQDMTRDSYLWVSDVIKTFPVPAYYIPGNHDDPAVIADTYPHATLSDLKNIVLDHWNIVLLDSQKVGKVEGYLHRSQLDFLEDSLKRHPKHRAIIALHHHPVPSGCKWLDRFCLTNADEFWEIASRYSQIHTVLFGHIHQHIEGQKNGISYYSSPSTCFQFKKQSPQFALENIPPGYRWIDLHNDGKLETGVRRVDHYVGVFDPKATGY